MHKYVLFLLPVLFISIAHANIIEYQEQNIELTDRLYSYFETHTNYSEITTDKIYFLVYGEVTNVFGKDAEGDLLCITERHSYGTEIICNRNYKNKTYYFDLNFLVLNAIKKQGTGFEFVYDIGIREPIKELKVKVKLPETYVLKSESTEDLSPQGVDIKSTGRSIYLLWDIDKPELGNTYTFRVPYEKITQKTNMTKYVVVISILMVLVVVLLYLYISKKSHKKVLSVLIEDEKKIIDAINHYGDGCKQKDVVKYTNFSKAKVSRLIDNLEKRNIIRRERIGKIVKLYLLDESLKDIKKDD